MTATRILRATCAQCGTEWRCPDVDPEEPLTFEAECWRCYLPTTWTTWEVAEVRRWYGPSGGFSVFAPGHGPPAGAVGWTSSVKRVMRRVKA